jgi:hypothetical protein
MVFDFGGSLFVYWLNLDWMVANRFNFFAIDGRRQYPSKKKYLEKIWCKYNTIPIVVKLFPFFLPLPIVPWHHGEIIMFLQDGAPVNEFS